MLSSVQSCIVTHMEIKNYALSFLLTLLLWKCACYITVLQTCFWNTNFPHVFYSAEITLHNVLWRRCVWQLCRDVTTYVPPSVCERACVCMWGGCMHLVFYCVYTWLTLTDASVPLHLIRLPHISYFSFCTETQSVKSYWPTSRICISFRNSTTCMATDCISYTVQYFLITIITKTMT